MKFTIGIGGDGALEALRYVEERQKWIEERTQELVRRLAERGASLAKVSFSEATYDGNNDVSVSVEERGDNAMAVVAVGNAVLFIEFGSGLIGYGHPEVKGYGPSTYSMSPEGKQHWDDPKGWYYAHGKKSHGNPPSASMYNARKQLAEEYASIAREVFSH